jgi:hypothetical protein
MASPSTAAPGCIRESDGLNAEVVALVRTAHAETRDRSDAFVQPRCWFGAVNTGAWGGLRRRMLAIGVGGVSVLMCASECANAAMMGLILVSATS